MIRALPHAPARSAPAPAASTMRRRAVALWSLHAILAAVVVGVLALTPPSLAHLQLEVWLGNQVRDLHALPLGWLGALLTASLYGAGGLGGLAFASALAVVAALGLVEVRAGERARPLAALAATFLAALTMWETLRVGGGAPTWLFGAALLLALDATQTACALLAIPLTLVWCNVGPEGLLAPALAGLVAAGRSFDGGFGSPAARRASLVALGCLAATLCTPAGLAYWPRAFDALHLDRALAPLVALHPIDTAPQAYRIGFTAIVLLAALFHARRRSVADDLTLAFAIVLALGAGALLPLLGIVAAPLLAASIGPAVVEATGARLQVLPALAVATLTAVLGASVWLAGGPRAIGPSAQRVAPLELIASLAAQKLPQRLFCSDLEWCSYAVGLGMPQLEVLMDGRLEMYGPAVRASQVLIARVRPGWPQALERARIDTAIVGRREPLASLLELHGWQRVANDDRAFVFIRPRSVVQ